MNDDLTLSEALLLLALDDRTGKNRAGAALPFGLAAAALVDLALRGHLRLQNEAIAVGETAPTGNSVLDDAEALIAAEAKPKKPAVWVGVVAQKIKKLPDRVAAPLVERRVLRAEEGKVLGLFPVTRYPLRDRSIERDLHDHIRRVASGSLRTDDRAAALIALVNSCGILKTVFDGPNLGEAKDRAQSFGAADTYTRPARDLVAALLKGLGQQLQQNRAS